MKHKELFKRLISALLVALLLTAALPAALAATEYCPARESDTGTPLGHDWGKWKVKKEATCEKEGKKERRCKYCGQSDTKKIKKTDHRWSEWTITVEATDRSTGRRERTCTACDAYSVEDLYPEGTLKRGDKGEAVKALQNALNAKGYDCGKADGSFGRKTEDAVKAFEATIGITGDGIAWPAVIAALSGRSDPPDEEVKMITVTIIDPNGSYAETVRHPAGEPFTRILQWSNVIVYKYDINKYGRSYGFDQSFSTATYYKPGMCFDCDVWLSSLETGYKVSFHYNGTIIDTCIVDPALGGLHASEDRYPHMIVDGKWVRWYTQPGGGKEIWEDTRQTDYYGVTCGVCREIQLGNWNIRWYNAPTLDSGPTCNKNLTDSITVLGVVNGRGKDSDIQFYAFLWSGDNHVYYTPVQQADAADDEYIFLHANGGTVETDMVPSTTDYNDFPIPMREDHDFLGWEQTDYNTYTAQWKEVEYADVYTRPDSSREWSPAGACRIGTADYTLPDYNSESVEVTGWRLVMLREPEQSEPVACDRAFTPGEALTGDVYLQPEVIVHEVYTVRFDTRGIFEWIDAVRLRDGATLPEECMDPEPTKDGYTFTGWTVVWSKGNEAGAAANETPRAFAAGSPVTQNLKLRAEYTEPISYTIHFDAGVGNSIKGTKYFFARHLKSGKTGIDGRIPKEDIPVATPGDKKLNFEGWYTADGERVDADTVFTEDTTVYASWSSNPTVSFVRNKK